jgi:hypothetical protein
MDMELTTEESPEIASLSPKLIEPEKERWTHRFDENVHQGDGAKKAKKTKKVNLEVLSN